MRHRTLSDLKTLLRGEQSKERALRARDLAAGFKILESCRRGQGQGGHLGGLQDPRLLPARFKSLEFKKGSRRGEGSAAGFKILVFCRPGDRDAEKKKRANQHTGDLYTQMRRLTALRMFLSYVMAQTRKRMESIR